MDLIQGFTKGSIHSSLKPDRFHLILFPTEQCNFRCVYCYEDFAIGEMKPWLIEAIKLFLKTKIPKVRLFNLSWFGGEPLLAKKILFELSEYANDLSNKNGVKLIGDITTNGLLLDVKTLERLVSLNQKSFQISIDGDSEHHNKTRLTRTGKESFERIFKRLIDASNTNLDFSITLRVHVTAYNQDSVRRFCKLYEQNFKSDRRFKLFFKAIEDLGGDSSEDALKLSDGGKPRDIAYDLQNLYEPIEKQGNYICYAAKPNSLGIRANGNLTKCTVALKEDYNKIGRIMPDGSLEVVDKKFSNWLIGFEGLDKWKLGCPHSFFQSQEKKNKNELNIPIIEVA